MKRRLLPISVACREGMPCRVRNLAVERVLETWTLRSRWWEQEERRTYYRLETARGILDVFEREGQWFLATVLD